jgi:hypothetical protein
MVICENATCPKNLKSNINNAELFLKFLQIAVVYKASDLPFGGIRCHKEYFGVV